MRVQYQRLVFLFIIFCPFAVGVLFIKFGEMLKHAFGGYFSLVLFCLICICGDETVILFILTINTIQQFLLKTRIVCTILFTPFYLSSCLKPLASPLSDLMKSNTGCFMRCFVLCLAMRCISLNFRSNNAISNFQLYLGDMR